MSITCEDKIKDYEETGAIFCFKCLQREGLHGGTTVLEHGLYRNRTKTGKNEGKEYFSCARCREKNPPRPGEDKGSSFVCWVSDYKLEVLRAIVASKGDSTPNKRFKAEAPPQPARVPAQELVDILRRLDELERKVKGGTAWEATAIPTDAQPQEDDFFAAGHF